MSEQNKALSQEAINYDNSMHRLGRISMVVLISMMLAIPFIISAVFGEKPNLSPAFWTAFIPIILVNLPGSLIEVITYTPLLGTGGT
ncbi:MAG: hypothetical protein RSE24_02365, partial [Oscillospiraceae bacterium]